MRSHKKIHLSIANFINTINNNLHRSKGFGGTNLIKFHFHLPKCIKMWGPPCGWDSSFHESHHKTEVKAPLKNVRSKQTAFTKHNVAQLAEQKTFHNQKNEVDNNKDNGIHHAMAGPKHTVCAVSVSGCARTVTQCTHCQSLQMGNRCASN